MIGRSNNNHAAKREAREREARERLEDQIRDALIQNGFLPVDDDSEMPADLGWTITYGCWDAYRDNGDTVDLCRFSEDGITLTRSTRNYVILTEATLTLTNTGLAWLTKVIAP
jgi:hypothetical protein